MSKRKAIYFTSPAHGHINPTLPLIRELVNNGERIICYSTEDFREKLKGSGAEFRPYNFNLDQSVIHNYVNNHFKLSSLGLRLTKDFIGDNLRDIEKENPDYILHDSLSVGGKCIAKKLNIKAVSTISTFVFNNNTIFAIPEILINYPGMILGGFADFLKCLNIRKFLRKRHKMDFAIEDMSVNEENLNIVFTSRHFQPNSSKLDPRYKFVGPSITKREAQSDFPFHKLENGKVIYISLGTVHGQQYDFYKKCFEAFAGKEWIVVLSVGNFTRIEDLGKIPANFIVGNYVPQLKILEKADLFISHSGMNSVNESLYHSVPLILIPQQLEQLAVAKRVERLGAGICLNRSRINPQILYKTAQKVISDSNYRTNAEKTGKTLKEAGGYKRAAEEIKNYIEK